MMKQSQSSVQLNWFLFLSQNNGKFTRTDEKMFSTSNANNLLTERDVTSKTLELPPLIYSLTLVINEKLIKYARDRLRLSADDAKQIICGKIALKLTEWITLQYDVFQEFFLLLNSDNNW